MRWLRDRGKRGRRRTLVLRPPLWMTSANALVDADYYPKARYRELSSIRDVNRDLF
jgi:hypothetical protein